MPQYEDRCGSRRGRRIVRAITKNARDCQFPKDLLVQKYFISLALIIAALSPPASAQINYTYTGNPFTLFSCGPFIDMGVVTGTLDCTTAGPNANTSYKTGDHVSATLTLTTPLGANLTLADVKSLPGFVLTLNDGEQTLSTSTHPPAVVAKVSTDATGNIIAPWQLEIFLGNASDTGIASFDDPSGAGVIDEGVLACCDPTVPGNLALNQSSAFPPGTGAGAWGAGGGTGKSFPTGTFIRLTQFTTCCSGFVVDNDDIISGGLNKTPTWGGTGSDLGDNWASAYYKPIVLDLTKNPPIVTNNGPSVGAYSDSNQGSGFGRAIAFATFTNNSSTTHLRAHADLSGEFIQDSFGLPNGFLAAGAAIHVFDTDKFNAAISAATDGSDAAIGKFLLNGYSASAGLTPSAGIASLDVVLASALIGEDTKYYSNGPFNPPTPISSTLNAAFTIPSGKNYTVVFDVVASGIVEGNPDWAIGTGQVNFADTLKPSATFFTDDNGNPVSGIGAVGSLPSLPAGPAALTLAPATGQLLMENPYTVTANVTDASSKPIAGASVKFAVASGPDAGVSGVSISDASGSAKFTYKGLGGAGTDTIHASIGAILSNPVQVMWQSAKCPQPQGFWKNNLNTWPVTSLTLGSQTYTQADLMKVLNSPGGADASMILAIQLIASKLDIANGSDAKPIRSAGATADSLLSGFAGKLPYNVKPNSTVGQSMTLAGSTLQTYTTGALTPGCTP